MDDIKSQLANRLKEANNVLVSVKNNPTVDQFAAAIALTLILNKLGKHATTVFSGTIPSTIEFLKPEKVVEATTDSLRDFIISLDKAKADKLRYKIEDNFVKIFITPYHTSISQNDLVFSQGDFNVDVVVGLGVHQREELDQAITAHGRILHDATVTTINTQPPSNLGSINWSDGKSSSLCEMLVGIVDLLGKPGIIDSQIANALLTGIVAETQRFSNTRTTAQTMSASSLLLAAGANQQLVATQLTPKPAPTPPPVEKKETEPEQPKTPLKATPNQLKNLPKQPNQINKSQEGELQIHHKDNPYDQLEPEPTEDQVTQVMIDEQGELKTLDADRPVDPAQPHEDVLPEVKPPDANPPQFTPPPPDFTPPSSPSPPPPADSSQNSGSLMGSPKMVLQPPTMGENVESNEMDEDGPVDIFDEGPKVSDLAQNQNGMPVPMLDHNSGAATSEPAKKEMNIAPPSSLNPAPPSGPAGSLDDVRSAVNNALTSSPSNVSNQPLQSLNAQPVNLDLNNGQGIQQNSSAINTSAGNEPQVISPNQPPPPPTDQAGAPPVPPPILPLSENDLPPAFTAL